MKNVIMIDLETLSTRANAVVLAIGVAGYDRSGTPFEFYTRLDFEEQLGRKRVCSQSTIEWWMSRDADARNLFKEPKTMASTALLTLQDLLNRRFEKEHLTVLGNGANFDVSILENMYHDYDIFIPWKYQNVACYRTLKELTKSLPTCKLERKGTHHNALDDAKSQLEHFVRIMDELTKRIV